MSTTISRGKRRLQKTISLLIGALVLLSLSLYAPLLHADAVVSTIPVGKGPVGLGVDLQSNTIYVANHDDGTVSVINGNTNTVETVIPVAFSRGTRIGFVWFVAVNSVTGKVFVAVQNEQSSVFDVAVISDATHTVIATIQINPVTAIAVNTATNRVYVDGGYQVTVLDGDTYSVIATIPTPGIVSNCLICSFGIDVNPATNTVYVSSIQQLYVIDGITNTVIRTIPVAGGACFFNVAVDSATNRIYVGACNGNVLVVDGATNTIITTIPVNTGVRAVGVDSITNRIYADNGTITVIDGSANTIIQVVPVGSIPLDIAVNSATNRIYVSNHDDNTVSVISGLIAETNTSTAVNCTPSTVAVNQPTQCTATVTDTSATPTSPIGNVIFSSSCSSPPCGSFAPARTCQLSSTSSSTSSCSVSYTPSPGTEGLQTIRATYDADSTHQGSSGATSLQVTQRSTSTTVSCSPRTLRARQSTTCAASVTDTSSGTPITPTGSVAWTSSGMGSFSPNPCTLSGTGSTATCTVTYTPSSGRASIQTIKGTYTGDTDHLGSSGSTTIAVA